MAFKRTLAQRLFNISTTSRPTPTSCLISSSTSTRMPHNPEKVDPDPGDDSIFRRFLQRRPLYESATSRGIRSLPVGPKLLETLRGMDIVRDRIRFDGLSPPVTVTESPEEKFTVDDARKLLKISQLEMLKSKLRQITENCISHKEFIQICVESCSSENQGLEFAKMLDDSGTVIVLGNVVFLRPDQGK